MASLVDATPNVRHLMENRLGSAATEVVLSLTNAALQALGQGPLALLVDIAQRATLVGEAQSRRRSWSEQEPALHPKPLGDRPKALEPAQRLAPFPAGPIETYAERISYGTLGIFGLSLAATRDARGAAAVLLAGAPRAARLGREAFAAHLARVLADRKVLVLDGGVLRRLDRVDTVMIDASVLSGARAGRVMDLASLDAEVPAGLDQLVAAVREGGHLLVACGFEPGMATRLGVDRSVRGGRELLVTIRGLQAEGRMVFMMSLTESTFSRRS